MKLRDRIAKNVIFVVVFCVAFIICSPSSYATGIDYVNLATLSGNRFTPENLKEFTEKLRDEYVPIALSNITETFSSVTPTVANLKIGLDFVNNSAPSSGLAYVSSNGYTYKLVLNLAKMKATPDYKVKTDDLFFTTINHEMMHAVMFDVTTNGMIGKRDWNANPVREVVDELPDWFYEGIAQAVGGGVEHTGKLVHDLYYRLPLETRESLTKEWLSKFNWLGYESYAQGYIATLYIGMLAGDGHSITTTNIAHGLNLILKDLEDGYSFGETISRRTGKYSDLEDMRVKFADDAYQFAIDFVEAIDTDDPGAGSIASTGGLKAKASVLYTGRSTKSNFFTLDISKLGDADNTNILTGKLVHTGGGMTKTERIKRDGSLNEDASEIWPTPSGTQYNYLVKYFIENTPGNFSLHSVTNLTTSYNSVVDADVKTIEGFKLDISHNGNTRQKTIRGNGQVLSLYYKRVTNQPIQNPSQSGTWLNENAVSSNIIQNVDDSTKSNRDNSRNSQLGNTDASSDNTIKMNQQENSGQNQTKSTPKNTTPIPEAKASNETGQSSNAASMWILVPIGVLTTLTAVIIVIKRKR